MTRSYAAVEDGRIVIYASDDGELRAFTRPRDGRWWVVTTRGGTIDDDRWEGPFRSEGEAMDQARGRVRWYEQEAGR